MAVQSDPLADFLIRIKNAYRASKEECRAPYSRMKAEVARILQEEGYIWSYEVESEGKRPEIVVKTKFVNSSPALTDLKKVSKPGRRQYVGCQEIPRVLGGLGISIVSTSKGVMTGGQARREKVGGEFLAQIW